MIGTLFRKELRQHGVWMIIINAIFVAVALIASFAANVTGSGAGVFAGLTYGLILMVPISAMILSNLLVHSEFQNQTQLFLAGLPFAKWKMITIKLIIAMVSICWFSITSIMICWLIARGSEAVTLNFLLIMLASACGFSVFIMGVFFVIGFLGRYRIYIVFFLIIFVTSFNSVTPFSMWDFSPFSLVDPNKFGLERDIFPSEALAWTLGFTLVSMIVAFVLGTVKEGSIATMLGEKMSYKEKMFIGGSIGMLYILLSTFAKTEEPIPFSTPGAVHESWQGVNVYLSPIDPDQPADLEIKIASRLAKRLAKQRDWLGIPPEQFPDVYIIENNDVERVERIEEEEIPDKNKVKLYAGIRQKAFSEDRLLSWTLSQIFVKRSMRRVYEEQRWWIVCGLEGLWEMEEADSETRKKRIQMAVDTVTEHGLTVDNVLGWSKYQDDTEWRNADAVAWMGMKHLSETRGLKIVQKLAQASVVIKVDRKDSKPVYWHYFNPVPKTFDRITGLTLEQFVEEWRASILVHQSNPKLAPSKTK